MLGLLLRFNDKAHFFLTLKIKSVQCPICDFAWHETIKKDYQIKLKGNFFKDLWPLIV